MKRLALIAIAVFLGLALWAGLTIAQQNPWWHPLNPNGQSAGVTYGTVLPTLANTGNQLTDGLLAVQLTAGSQPDFQIYDASTASWISLTPGGSGAALVHDFLPRWDGPNAWFEDSPLRGTGNPAAGASGSLLDLTSTLNAAAAGNIVNGLFVDLTMGAHTGGQINGIHIDGITGTAATESALYIGAGWDRDIEFEDTAEVVFLPATFDFVLGTTAPGTQFWLRDTDAFQEYSEIALTVPVMNGTDTEIGLTIDIENADHTGATNILRALYIDGITADAQATERAITIGHDWDRDIQLNNTTRGELGYIDSFRIVDEDAGFLFDFGNSSARGYNAFNVSLAPINEMNGSDAQAGIRIGFTNANHTGADNYLRGIWIDSIVEDPDAYETGISIGNGFDGHITILANAAVYADNPPAGAIALFIDDNADWSGGGGNDCAIVAKDSTGATDVITVLVLNGACP